VTLSGAVMISLLVSLTTTPMMCAYLLQAKADEKPEGPVGRAFARGFAWLHRSYEHSLDFALSAKPLMILILAAIIGLNVYLYMAIPKGFFPNQDSGRLQGGLPDTIEEAIARATMFTAGGLKIRAIAALTQSGRTVLLMSRRSSTVPIFALSPQEDTRRKMTLFRGVYPVKFGGGSNDPEIILNHAENELLRRGAVRNGDLIIMTIGEPVGKAGGTNTMKIVKVGEHRKQERKVES